MKQSTSSDTVSDFSRITLDKILSIEKDIMELKLSVFKKLSPTGKKLVKLKGIAPGVDITDKDIAFAKRALYGKTRI